MLPFTGASPPTSSRSLAATDPVIISIIIITYLYMQLHVAVLASSLTARWRPGASSIGSRLANRPTHAVGTPTFSPCCRAAKLCALSWCLALLRTFCIVPRSRPG